MNQYVFQNGDEMPILGLGTWRSEPGEVAQAVRAAIEIGYRHIDCAWIYGNEPEIGQTINALIKDGIVTREELWITSKLWNDCHAPEDVRGAIEISLRQLQLDYLDLYLVHWPVCVRKGVYVPKKMSDYREVHVPAEKTWQAMESLQSEGLTRHIGVSNFSKTKLLDLLPKAKIRPEINQIESHPYLQQTDLFDFCQEQNIGITAYAPLGSRGRPDRLKEADEPILLEDPTILQIAESLGVLPAQVLISWAIHRNCSVIPKSTNPGRLKQNFGAASLSLSAADMEAIAKLDLHRRYINGETWTLNGSPYTLNSIWDEN